MNIWKAIAFDTITKTGEKKRKLLLRKLDTLLRLNYRQKLMLGLLLIFTGKYAIIRFFCYGLDMHAKISGIVFFCAFLLFLSVFFLDIRLLHIKKRLLLLQPLEDDVSEMQNNN